MANSTISGNTATTSGGGFYVSGATVITNTTISGNTANYGGGMFADAGIAHIVLTHTTIADNIGTIYGGGIYFSDAEIFMAGVLLKAGPSGENCISDSSYQSLLYDDGYNLSDDNNCGFFVASSANNIPLNLGPLQDNGGPTLTQLPGAGSPALDRIPHGTTINNDGTTYTCNQNGQPLDTDQRGDPHPSPASGNCDVGAVEFSFDFTAQKPILVSPAAVP